MRRYDLLTNPLEMELDAVLERLGSRLSPKTCLEAAIALMKDRQFELARQVLESHRGQGGGNKILVSEAHYLLGILNLKLKNPAASYTNFILAALNENTMALEQILSIARGNNREGCINAIEECYEIIKTLKPQPITYKTELAALASMAESLKMISEKR